MANDRNIALTDRRVEIHRGIRIERIDISTFINIGKRERTSGMCCQTIITWNTTGGKVIIPFVIPLIT